MKTPRNIDRSIVLVGLMGAGKSTIGRRLARKLRLEFVDSDTEIEHVTGYPVGEMFERFGEEAFRDGERRVVARLVEGPPRVIATGGGVFVNPDTRALLNGRAVTIWLDAPIEVLADRTGRRDTRPLLRGGDRLEILRKLGEERSSAYSQAHIRVPTSVSPHQEVVEAVIRELIRHFDG